MHLLTKSFLCLLVCLCSMQAQSLSSLQQVQQDRLEAAIEALNKQRNAIQAQQLPLARQLNDLEAQAKKLRGELSEARKVRDSRSVALESLKQTVEAQRNEYNYIMRTLFSEYNSNYESGLSAGELETYGASIRELNLFLEDTEKTELARLEKSLGLLNESLARIESTIGGKDFSGAALNADGELIRGTFLQIGPLLYFSDSTGTQAGIAEDSKTLQPRIRSVSRRVDSAIAEVISQKSGRLPMDLSLGNALALEATKDTLFEHLRKGGIWVYPIIAFALVSAFIALLKFTQIMTIRQPTPATVHKIVRFLKESRPEDALELAKAQPQPSQDMLVQAVKHSNESFELVEEAMYESMLIVQPQLEKYLNIIAVTAAVAPLLGLLGTVTGIIKTFNLMQVFGAGDPKPLISGISEALITTELGLILAIPALVIHAFLSRKVAGIMAHVEKLSVTFLNSLSRQTDNG